MKLYSMRWWGRSGTDRLARIAPLQGYRGLDG